MENLVNNNKERAIMIASLVATRLQVGRAWQGYRPCEGLNGELVTDRLLRYQRPVNGDSNDFALVFFDGPRITEPETVNFGEEQVLEENVIERFTEPIKKVKGVAYEDTISHTFSKTTTMQEGFKIGAEQALEAYFKASGSGMEGGLKVSAKLTEEYSRQWGESVTTTDTVERHVSLPADYAGEVTYEAIRSVNKVQRKVTANSNMDYRISFVSGPTVPPENHPLVELNWESLDEFLSVAQGNASTQHAGYELFIDNPISDAEVESIKKAGKQTIEFLVSYDNVQTQEINIVDKGETK